MNRKEICLWAKLTDKRVCCEYWSSNVTCLFKEVCIDKKCNKIKQKYKDNDIAQGSSWVTILGGTSNVHTCGAYGHGLVIDFVFLGWCLDMKFTEVFSKLSDSMIR